MIGSQLLVFLRRALWQDWGTPPLVTAQHLRTRAQKRDHILGVIDGTGFGWLVVAVAASGFFTDSYNLFATNVILPTLGSVYWNNDETTWRETLINEMTLSGSILGQLLFGYLADKIGRQRLYGVELVIVIFATLGVTQSSYGLLVNNNGREDMSMSIIGWLSVWRFFMGIGIGAEYPLSAVITAEWAPVSARAKMMATVFLMQPLGQAVAALVGLFVALGLNHQYGGLPPKAADQLWRAVTGVGAFPALIAIIFRFTITDSGRYTLDVKDQGTRAVKETRAHFYSQESLSHSELEEYPDSDFDSPLEEDEPLPVQFSRKDLKEYFIDNGNWRYLAGTSMCWFILDLAFYGLGLLNSRTLSTLWEEKRSGNLYQDLLDSAKRSIVTVSIGSLAGSIILINVIDRIPRRKILMWSYLLLAFLLLVTGICFFKATDTRAYPLTIVMYALCQLAFNLGPNTLTFIIPAEIFPTRYRGTCHGISAAAGKLGSVISVAILHRIHDTDRAKPRWLGGALIIYSIFMASGFVFAWAWIPDVQRPQRADGKLVLKSKTLEELAARKANAPKDGEIIGLRKRLGLVRSHLT